MPGKFRHLHVLYTFQRQVNFRKYRRNRGDVWTLASVNTADVFSLVKLEYPHVESSTVEEAPGNLASGR